MDEHLAWSRSGHVVHFQNQIPAWILSHPAYLALRAGPRHQLRVMADVANPPDVHGTLHHIIGGAHLWERVGCDKRTFYRRLRLLRDAGFIEQTSRGGQDGSTNCASVFAIPGTPANHRVGAKCTGGGRGKMPPGGRGKMPHYHNGSMVKKPYGAPKTEKRRKSHGGWGRLTASDLADDNRLYELYLIAVARGWIEQSEASLLRFFSWAESALHWPHGYNPCGMFVANVREQRTLYITGVHEDAAQRRIVRMMQERD